MTASVTPSFDSPGGPEEQSNQSSDDGLGLQGQPPLDPTHVAWHILDALPIGVLLADPEGVPFFLNSAGRSIAGKDLIRGALAELPELYRVYRAGEESPYPLKDLPLNKALRGETSQVDDMEIRRPDKTVALAVRGTPIRDESGEIEMALVTFEDETEKRSLMHKADLLAKHNWRIINYAGDGIYSMNGAGEVVSINPSAAAMLDWNVDEVVGSPAHDIFHHSRPDGSEYPKQECPIYLALKTGEVQHSSSDVFFRSDGSRVEVEWISAPLFEGESIVGAVVTFRDIARRLAEKREMAEENEELIKAKESLKAAKEQLESTVNERTKHLKRVVTELEGFAYTVAHDLRAPLRAIDGFSRIALEEHGDSFNEATVRYLALIRSNAQQMGQLIDQLLSFSRLSRSELQVREVELEALVEDARRMLNASLMGKDVTIEVDEDVVLTADPVLLRQVLVNLLDNAAKYSREGNPIIVHIGSRTDPGNATSYFVKDNGIGFDMKYATKVFKPFQRLHLQEEFEGTGIGLATVERIIERHGGKVWVDSEAGVGTTVWFTLHDSGQAAD